MIQFASLEESVMFPVIRAGKEPGCHGDRAALSPTVSVGFSFLSVSAHLFFIRDTQITVILQHEAMSHTGFFIFYYSASGAKRGFRRQWYTCTSTIDRRYIYTTWYRYIYTNIHMSTCSPCTCKHALSNRFQQRLRCEGLSVYDRCAPRRALLISACLSFCLSAFVFRAVSPHYISGRLCALIGPSVSQISWCAQCVSCLSRPPDVKIWGFIEKEENSLLSTRQR